MNIEKNHLIWYIGGLPKYGMIYQIDPNETLCMALSGGGKGKTAISKTRKGKLTAQLPCSVFFRSAPRKLASDIQICFLGSNGCGATGGQQQGVDGGKTCFY